MANTYGQVAARVYDADWLHDGTLDQHVQWTTRHGLTDLVLADTDILPDLDDPATLGGLLSPVREAYDCPSLQCGHVGGWDEGWDSWIVGNPPGRGHGCVIAGTGSTEAEALVAALEAAP